jgi:predicted permease
MVEMFADTYTERRRQGLLAVLRLWYRTLRDLCVNVVAAWLGLDPSPIPVTHTHSVHQRRTTWSTSMDNLTADLRYAFRTLRRNPEFAFVTTITLALGIGATSAIFSVVNGVLLRPLPYPEQERLAVIWTQYPDQGNPEFPISPAEFLDYREESRAFAEIGALGLNTATVSGEGGAERVATAGITHSLIPVLDIRAAVGRTFTADEDQPGAPNVILLSDRYWRRRFGGDRSAIGTSLVVNDASQTVIGVLAPDFRLPGLPQVDLFLPLRFDRASITNRSGHWLTAVGRLAPGATIESANREIDAMLIRWEAAYAGQHTPDPSLHPMFTLPLTEELFGDVRPLLVILLMAVGLVLLLACANVANLLLARGEARRRELGIRTALGASRGRVVRQLLTESTVLAIGAGVFGLLLGAIGTDLLLRMEPGSLPRANEIGLDWRVAVVTLLVSIATGVIFGMAPAVSAVRARATEGLTTSDRSGSTRRESRRLLRGLTVLQMALASVLLISSGLLVKSFAGLLDRHPGFDAERRLAFDVELTPSRYPTREAVVAFYDRLLEEVRAAPGVESAAAARGLPMRERIGTEGMDIEGRPALRPEEQPFIDYQQVTPGYFETMAVPILSGREFAESDQPDGMPVALLNETAARAYFPSDEAIGERIRPLFAGPNAQWRTIVGIVGDVRHRGLGQDARPELYLTYAQTPPNWAVNVIRGSTIVVRGAIPEETLGPLARRIVQAIDPDVPISNMGALDEAIAQSVSTERFATLLLGAFAGVALVIAAIGVYGVMAFTVARRSKEIGIRLALGAEPARVMRSVISGGLLLAGIGGGLGILVALAATRVLQSQLYGVGARDPLVFASAIAVLGFVATLAVSIPALRASGTDPTRSLRNE